DRQGGGVVGAAGVGVGGPTVGGHAPSSPNVPRGTESCLPGRPQWAPARHVRAGPPWIQGWTNGPLGATFRSRLTNQPGFMHARLAFSPPDTRRSARM